MPEQIDQGQYIQNAADEIDICMSKKFETPIVLDVNANPAQRPLQLLLKQINAQIATGRMLLAATLSKEDTVLNAYGYSLLQGGLKNLENLESGETLYPGMIPLPGQDDTSARVLVGNQDSRSGVDAFYASQGIPGQSFYPEPYPRSAGWW
jgi:hypothetical protein